MKINSQPKRSVHSNFNNRSRMSTMPPKRPVKIIFSDEDFMKQITAMKERGDVSIIGKRIC